MVSLPNIMLTFHKTIRINVRKFDVSILLPNRSLKICWIWGSHSHAYDGTIFWLFSFLLGTLLDSVDIPLKYQWTLTKLYCLTTQEVLLFIENIIFNSQLHFILTIISLLLYPHQAPKYFSRSFVSFNDLQYTQNL